MNKPVTEEHPSGSPAGLGGVACCHGMSRRSAPLVALAAVLIAIPLFVKSGYYMDLAIRVGINAVVVIALNLLAGFAGQISLGHAAFMGIGAYSSAIMTVHFGICPELALVAGAAISGALAFIVARPILKLKGHYLAMATLGLGIIVSIVITNEANYTGGPDGMNVGPLTLLGFDVNSELKWYAVVATLLVVVLLCAQNIVRSPAGRALQSIKGSEIAARVVGIDTARFKTKAFVLSAIVASVMGSVSAHYVGFLTPGMSGFFHSIELMTMVVVGGMASLYGSLIGALLLTVLPQLLATFEGLETLVFGVVLVVVMIFMPRGLVPTIAGLGRGKGEAR